MSAAAPALAAAHEQPGEAGPEGGRAECLAQVAPRGSSAQKVAARGDARDESLCDGTGGNRPPSVFDGANTTSGQVWENILWAPVSYEMGPVRCAASHTCRSRRKLIHAQPTKKLKAFVR